MKRAKGEVKQLLICISEIQSMIGVAQNLHYNDRSRTSFEEAQNLLKNAFNKCVKATEPYDPVSYDPAYQKVKP